MARVDTNLTVQMDAQGQGFLKEVQKVSAATRNFSQQINNVGKQARRTANQVSRMRQTMSGLANIALTAFGAHQVRALINWGDEIAKTSRRLGVTAERLQTLQYAADSLNIPIKQITSGLTRLQANIGDLNLSSNELRTSLLDIDKSLIAVFKQAQSTEEIFDLWLDTMKKTDDATKQLTLTNALFGKRAGAAFIQIYREGGEELSEFIGRQEELSSIVGGDTLVQLERANQAFADMGATLKAAGANIFAFLAPALEFLASSLAAVSRAAGAVADFFGKSFDFIATKFLTDTDLPGADIWRILNLTDDEIKNRVNEINEELKKGTQKQRETRLERELSFLKAELATRKQIVEVIEKGNAAEQAGASGGTGGKSNAAAQREQEQFEAYLRRLQIENQFIKDGEFYYLGQSEALAQIVKQHEQVAERIAAEQELLEEGHERYSQLQLELQEEFLAKQEAAAQRVQELHDAEIEKLEEKNRKLAEQRQRVEELAERYGGQLVDGLLAGANAGDVLRDVIRQIINDLIRQLVVAQLVQAVMASFGAASPVQHANPISGYSIGPGAASGGRIARGGMVRVGEAGPELVALPQGAEVYPRGDLSQQGRGDIVINVDGVQDPTVVENAIRRASAEIEQNVIGRVERNKGIPGAGRVYQ